LKPISHELSLDIDGARARRERLLAGLKKLEEKIEEVEKGLVPPSQPQSPSQPQPRP